MMRIEKAVATLPGPLPAIFEARDTAFVKADGAAEVFGVSFHAGLPPDESDEDGDGDSGPPERDAVEGLPEQAGDGQEDEQTEAADAAAPVLQNRQAVGTFGQPRGVDFAW